MKKNNDFDINIPIEPNPRLPQEVLDAYKEKKLVIFVGAGISRLMGCMGWEQMANNLIGEVCNPATADQIINSNLDSKAKITIAKRYAYKQGNEQQFWEIFNKAIQPNKDETRDIYETIAKLDGIFITTNCDGLLVKHFSPRYTTKCTYETLRENEDNRYLFCIHGNYGDGTEADLNSLVFTVDEYMTKYATESPLVRFLKYVMGEKHVVFIGYGLNEFEIISKAFRSDEKIVEKHYILEGFFTYQQELANAQAEYYKSQGVKLIAYSKDECGYDQQREILEQWVDQLYRETPYASRSLIRATDALRDFTPENKSLVLNAIARTDDLGETSLQAVFDAIPSSKDCYKWLDLLIDEAYVTEDRIPSSIKTSTGIINQEYKFFTAVIKCIDKSKRTEDCSDKCRDFIDSCFSYVLGHKELLNNYSVVTQLVELSIKLGIVDSNNVYELWKPWIQNTADFGFYLLKENMQYISKWDDTLQSKYMCLLFTAPAERNDSVRHYWYGNAAKEIAENIKVRAKADISKYCFDQINSISDRLSFTTSLDDRFQFSSVEYDRAVFNAIETLMETLSEKMCSAICKHMVSNAQTTFGWQTALHFATKYHFTSAKHFICNPLLTHSTYVEFFYWLHEVITLLSENELKTVCEWIDEAGFGVDYTDDPERNTLIKERINTYKYQLYGLVVKADDRYQDKWKEFALLADTERKTPVEDKKSHYSVKMESGLDDISIQTEITSDMEAAEIHHLVEETAHNSGWAQNEFIYRAIYDNLVERISKSQLVSYTDFVLELPMNEAVRFINVISTEKVLMKYSKTNVTKLINKLKGKASDKTIDDETREQISKNLIRIIENLKSCGWKYMDIYLTASKIDLKKVLPVVSEINTNMDIQTNILNLNESMLYHTVIESAANCKERDDIINDFKQWYSEQLNSSRKELFLLTCAYNFGYIAYIDDKWARNVVLSDFQCSECAEKLAYCMCLGITYVNESDARFISENNRIETIFNLISTNPDLYKYDSRFITYIVAAHYFGHISAEEYYEFLSLVPAKHADSIFGAIVSGIRGADYSKQKKLLKKSYERLAENNGSGIEFALINKIWHFEKLDSECWSLIESAISCVEIDRIIWLAINECVRKTKRDNIHMRKVISIICQSSIKLIEIGTFHFDSILFGLAKIHALSSVTELSKTAVFQNFSPNKYSSYVEAPEKVIDDFKDWVIDY